MREAAEQLRIAALKKIAKDNIREAQQRLRLTAQEQLRAVEAYRSGSLGWEVYQQWSSHLGEERDHARAQQDYQLDLLGALGKAEVPLSEELKSEMRERATQLLARTERLLDERRKMQRQLTASPVAGTI